MLKPCPVSLLRAVIPILNRKGTKKGRHYSNRSGSCLGVLRVGEWWVDVLRKIHVFLLDLQGIIVPGQLGLALRVVLVVQSLRRHSAIHPATLERRVMHLFTQPR